MHLSSSKLDHELGLSYYLTTVEGIDGKIRSTPEDFVVEEVLRNKLVIPVSPLNASNINIPLSGPGNYIRAILMKRNCATLTAIYMLSRSLKLPVSAFSFLGLKDAKAVTSQLISISSPSKMKLDFSSKSVRILRYVRSYAPVKPHELYGNRFTVKIRSLTLAKECIISRIDAFLSEIDDIGGLPAYFGYQRFGTIRPISHKIGRALLNGNFELAVKYMVEGYQLSSILTGRHRRFLPVNYESIILRYLESGCKDYFRLVKRVPRLLRKLFVNAYQSYIFNRMLSLRIKFGLPLNKAVIGDLVGFPIIGSIPKSQVFIVNKRNQSKVNRLIRRGVVSIVLPIIGYGTKLLPEGAALEPVSKVLEEERISPEDFCSKDLFSLNLYGAYRPVLFLVENFRVLNVDSSEDNGCTVILRFILRRGFYASILLRELMKPVLPNKSGF